LILPLKDINQKHEVFKVSFFRGPLPEAMVFLKKIKAVVHFILLNDYVNI